MLEGDRTHASSAALYSKLLAREGHIEEAVGLVLGAAAQQPKCKVRRALATRHPCSQLRTTTQELKELLATMSDDPKLRAALLDQIRSLGDHCAQVAAFTAAAVKVCAGCRWAVLGTRPSC